MANINRVTVSGRLARDPEVRTIREGLTVARIIIAVNDTTRSFKGEITEEVLYLECSVWNEDALKAQKYLSKGKAITVDGKLKQEWWKDKNSGADRTKLTLVAEKVVYMEKMNPLPTPEDKCEEMFEESSPFDN